MIRRFAKRYDFGGIPRDRWLASVGKLSPRDQARLRVRELVYSIYRALRAVMLAPITAASGVSSLFRLLGELERLHKAPRRKMREGVGCVIDIQTWLVNGRNIQLGDRVKISAFSSVIAGEHSIIKIGSNTIIGPSVTIVALNHGTKLGGGPIRDQEWVEASVEIGEDVWIGANVVILPGSCIGSGCVIGAGTVVKGILPAEQVVFMQNGSLVCRNRP
jgi:acetyltransferase-like isoleucine patch superfamily enzyme